MAKAKWCGQEIYDVAATFKERCLLRDDSLFTPGAAIWSVAHLQAVAVRVGVEDLGDGPFIQTLEAQLDGLAPAEIQLAIELLYILLLPEADTHGAKKREHINHLFEMLAAPTVLPPEADAALDAGGVAAFAAAKAYRDAGLRFLARLFMRVKTMAEGERASMLEAPWDFRALVGEIKTSTDAMQANAFLHLMFPEQFEYMVSEDHRQKLIGAFKDAPGVAAAEGPDRKIARIRELASVVSGAELGLYEEPFKRIWREDAPDRWIETVSWARRLFHHPKFDEWERDYKLRIAVKVAEARNAVLAGASDWSNDLRAAFKGENNLTSWREHDNFLKWCRAHDTDAGQLLTGLWGADDPTVGLEAFLHDLPTEAASGPGARLSIASFLLLGIDAMRFPFYKAMAHRKFKKLLGVSAAETFEVDPESVYRPEDLAGRLGLDGRRVRDFLRNAFPRGEDEHGAAWYLTPQQAQDVIDHFSGEIDPRAAAARYADWVSLLEELALRMLAAGTPIRDLLDAQGIVWSLVQGNAPEEWDEADRAEFKAFQSGGPVSPPRPGIDDTSVAPSAGDVALPAVTADLAKHLHLPEAWLERLTGLLAEKKQIILYGPPGTGKTFVAQHVGRHLRTSGGSYRLVQFHPSYTYEDFFEGYRPRQHENGALSFDLVHGALREIVSVAENDPRVPHLLIIDEINRGNIAKIFGELYFLLEYRDESIRLQYSRDEEFKLPRNLFIIGTMNTADRSIALVDSALRRRFYFMGLIPTREPIDRVLDGWLEAHGLDPEPAALLSELNRAIDDEDFSIGPSYFMTTDGTAPNLERIWTHAVMPLLEERYYGTGRNLDSEFGLAATRRRVAAAADDTEGALNGDAA